MALAKTLTFGKQMLMLGDGESSETFTAPCGFEQLTLTVNIATNDTNVPDCTDPDLPAWLVSSEVSKQMVLSGSGVLDTDAMQGWRKWFLAGGEKNVRWKTEGLKANGGGYYQAPGVLTACAENGQRGGLWQVSITINMNGKPTWTDAAA